VISTSISGYLYQCVHNHKRAFKNPIPDVKRLAPKDNMKAWVDRKSHVHYFGPAAAAFAGFHADPTI
jgi:mannitol-1-phosphate 5-dehydrogenase